MSEPIRVKIIVREEVFPDLYRSLAALPLKFRASYMVQKAAIAQITTTVELGAQLPRAGAERKTTPADSLHGSQHTTRSDEKLNNHIMALVPRPKAASAKA